MKRIYTYWDAGEVNAPKVVKYCMKSWRGKFGCRLHVVSREEAIAIVTEYCPNPDKLPAQVFADLLRMAILYQFGGVWVDATVLPNGSEADIWELIEPGDRVKVFNSPTKLRPCANWMISAESNNQLIFQWLIFYSRYWANGRRPLADAPVGYRAVVKLVSLVEPTILVSPSFDRFFQYFPYFACHFGLRYLIANRIVSIDCLNIFHYDYQKLHGAIKVQDKNALPLLAKLSWRDSYSMFDL